MASTRTEIDDENGELDDGLSEMRLWIRHRARQTIRWTSQLALLRIAPATAQGRARLILGLTVGQHAEAKRWLARAKARGVSAGGYMTFDEALHEVADEWFRTVIQVGLLKRAGRARQDIIAHAGLTEDEFDWAFGWWRDAEAACKPEEETAV